MTERPNTEVLMPKTSSKKSFILILFGLIALLLGSVCFYRSQYHVGVPRGGLQIRTDPDVDIYINHKHVGTGKAKVTWNELLSEPLFTSRTDVIGGTVIPTKSQGSSAGELFLTRTDGQLDQVFVIDHHFGAASNFKPLYVFIRLRSKRAYFANKPEIDFGVKHSLKIGKFAVG